MDVNRIIHGDALDVLRGLPDASVDAIITDPPYNGVKDHDWDNQWDSDDDFITWIGANCEQWRRVLKLNGSLYVFAWPRMAARVEVEIGRWFNVLNRITWRKPRFTTRAEMFDKDTMRAYFPASEAIIFAEQWGGDRNASGEAGYHEQYDEAKRQLKYTILAEYLASEFDRAGVTRKEIAALFPSKTGNMTGCVSNWLLGYNLPTKQQYHAMRDYLNERNCKRDYLRREYEYLRREYEDLRRPFTLTEYDQYTDVWTFATVGGWEPNKHPTQKPLPLMEHIVKVSTRPGDLVLDPFAGGGTTLVAARNLQRRYLGVELQAEYVETARKRLDLPYTLPMFDRAASGED